MNRISLIVVALVAGVFPCVAQRALIIVDSEKETGDFNSAWAWFGHDEPNYTYMKDGKKLLTELAALSPVPVYMRVHNLLTTGDGSASLKWGSTNAYTEDQQGMPVYNWSIVDSIFDTYIRLRMKPFAQIGFMPEAMSVNPVPYRHTWGTGKDAKFNTGWTYPPKDYNKWEELVYQWVKHCVERYGKAEVESWYWEVWNEPNIDYWSGTMEEYFKLYDFAANGLKRALPSARIGGPEIAGTSSPKSVKFLTAFIEHCISGTNYATGKTGSPLDLISFHAKGSPKIVDGHVRMNMAPELRDIKEGFRITASYPQTKDLPVIIGESDPEGCAACSMATHPQNAYRNGTMYSSYTAASFARIYALADSFKVNLRGIVSWSFEFENQPWFYGYRDLATNGVDKPVLNVFRMYGMMGGKRVHTSATGMQPLDTDVMLEYIFIAGRLREEQIFETAAMDYLKYADDNDHRSCSFASHLQRSVMLAKQMINVLDRGQAEEQKLLKQSVYMLSLHEVGHTLGLNHNMKASNLHDAEKIHNEKLGREIGLTGSVMDYSNVNVSPDPAKQGLYYDVIPGPYDHWAIRFGYTEYPSPAEETKKTKELLEKSSDHSLLFGNDADDMRSSGQGIDPRVMIDDMSSDPLAYCTGRLQLVNQTLPKLKDKFGKPGESYQGIRNSYFVLTSEIGISLRVVSRQIGGVYVDRSTVGQPGAGKPFMPVSYQNQKNAMAFINHYGFSPDAMKMPADLYAMLQAQRRGFNHYGMNEDPKLHDRMLTIHKDVLSQLLHLNTIQRITDSELYGNTYKLSEFFTDLTDGVFKDDLGKSVSTARQNLQTEYVNRLTNIQSSGSSYSNAAKAQAFSELNRIKKLTAKTVAPDAATKAHREYVGHLINKVMKSEE